LRPAGPHPRATIFAFTVSWAQFLYIPSPFTTSARPAGAAGRHRHGRLIKGRRVQLGADHEPGRSLGAAPPLIILRTFLMDYYIAGLTARRATKG